jgi:rhodanese-related sulfurtransferase
MKTLIAALVLVLPMVALADANDGFGKLTPQEVFAKLKQKNVYVIDNNNPEDFKEAHVPGAKWLHPNEYKPSELPSDKTATLIFYCANEH